MEVTITLNGKKITDSVDADMVLLDFCRKHKCFSVKRGCETGNCGLCSVLLDGKPVLSCSVPIGRASGRKVDTLEGLQEEAKKFSDFLQLRVPTSADSAIRVILLISWHCSGKIQIRQTKRSLNIYQAISAAVPDIRASCVRSATI